MLAASIASLRPDDYGSQNQAVAGKLVVIEFAGSRETAYWLEERLDEALRRKLIGVAAICMYSHNDYAISIRGEIRKAPTITRGLLPELDYQLARILRRGR